MAGIDYRIEWTDLAVAFATTVGGLSRVEEQVRGEIAELFDEGMKSITSLMFHVVSIGDQDFICTPQSEDVLIVDTSTAEEMEEQIGEGPLKGFKIFIPTPDSER